MPAVVELSKERIVKVAVKIVNDNILIYIPALSNYVPSTKGVIPSFLNMQMGFDSGYISYIDLENLTFIDNKLSLLGKQEIEVKRSLTK